MHVTAIHRAVERSLNHPVNYRTVKAQLSAGASRSKPIYERTSYGCYRLL